MRNSIVTKPINCEDSAVHRLINHSDELLASLYLEEIALPRTFDDLNQAGVRLVGAYNNDGELVGCGAVKLVRVTESYAEIKQLYIDKAHRGEGISVLLMEHLESLIRDSGIIAIKLETASQHSDAIALYQKLGYRSCEAFGCYRADPTSVFMQKTLH